MLTLQELRVALDVNEQALKAALIDGRFTDCYDLKLQRDELKNSLIDLLLSNYYQRREAA